MFLYQQNTTVTNGYLESFLSSQSMERYGSICYFVLRDFWQTIENYNSLILIVLISFHPLPCLTLRPPHPHRHPIPPSVSFSAWMFGRKGSWSCRPVLYIRCQASDRDSGLWVNNLTASTEDILLVKWSPHYFRWKETKRQRSKQFQSFTIVLQCKGLHLFESRGQKIKLHIKSNNFFLNYF